MQEIDRSSLTCGNQRSSSSLEEIVPKSEAKEEEELPRKKNKGRKKRQQECPAKENQADYGEIFFKACMP